MIKILLALVTSFAVVLVSTPALIRVAYLKRLVDAPDGGRKIHKRHIPTIGGIIIFAGTLFSYLLWYPIIENAGFKYIAASMLILFFIGVKDDLVGTAPVKKLAGHLVVAFILVIMAGVRISGMHGIFGIHELPYWASVLLSIFTYTVVVNAFNLIDGVDGLASTLGVLACLTFGTWFYLVGSLENAILAVALAGALIGFLFFNFSPAKIFMGDSGSLTIGLIVSVLAIRMIEFDVYQIPSSMVGISKPVLAMAAMAYPLIDTLRIFIIRMVQGKSPFSADRNHLHHKLMDLGLGHRGTVYVILAFTLTLVGGAIVLDVEASLSMVLLFVMAAVASQVPSVLLKYVSKKSQTST